MISAYNRRPTNRPFKNSPHKSSHRDISSKPATIQRNPRSLSPPRNLDKSHSPVKLTQERREREALCANVWPTFKGEPPLRKQARTYRHIRTRARGSRVTANNKVESQERSDVGKQQQQHQQQDRYNRRDRETGARSNPGGATAAAKTSGRHFATRYGLINARARRCCVALACPHGPAGIWVKGLATVCSCYVRASVVCAQSNRGWLDIG